MYLQSRLEKRFTVSSARGRGVIGFTGNLAR
jgi:hypothetical protein